MVDSVMVNVYDRDVSSSVSKALLFGDGSGVLVVAKNVVQNILSSRLKYLAAHGKIGETENVDQGCEDKVEFLSIQPSGVRKILSTEFIKSQTFARSEGASGGIYKRQWKFVWPIEGVPSATGNFFDVVAGSQAHEFIRSRSNLKSCFAVDFATGVTVTCAIKLSFSTPEVVINDIERLGGSSRVGVYFESGNPQAMETVISGRRMIFSSAEGGADVSVLLGNVLSHEIGHSVGLKDVNDRSNIMHYAATWEDVQALPFCISHREAVSSGTGIPTGEPQHQWETAK